MDVAIFATILLTCSVFAVLLGFIGFRQQSRLARGVAAAWAIEGARVSMLLLEARLGSLPSLLYVLLDLSYLPLTWLLWYGTTEFTGRQLTRSMALGYFGISSLVVLASHLFLGGYLEGKGYDPDTAGYWVTFINLLALFLPGAFVRFNLAYQFYAYWRRSRLLGALIAAGFGLPLAIGSLATPFEWYFQYSGMASNLFWFLQVLGLSVGVVILVLNQQEAELQAALARVRSLRGMLPICAGCKKIRNDRGYWDEVEAYLERHSDAEFSHGICPDCMRRLYPDEADELLRDSR